ncbi:MAG: carboxypeptidase-like regulatory domain-containing protein, partial [Planctomycetota bacterium]|nr:carboxypeptidase-like regulatory domain-containing protein [Planctomycetota bacterium]
RRTNLALLEQNQQANESLQMRIERLSAPASATPVPSTSVDWCSVRFRVHFGDPPGQPVAGCKLTMFGNLFEIGTRVSVELSTNADGIADFGLIRPGQYELAAKTPTGEWRELLVNVFPGRSLDDSIRCPDPTAISNIEFAPALSEELQFRGVWLICQFGRSSVRMIGDDLWTRPEPSDDDRVVLIAPDGKIVSFVGPLEGKPEYVDGQAHWPIGLPADPKLTIEYGGLVPTGELRAVYDGNGIDSQSGEDFKSYKPVPQWGFLCRRWPPVSAVQWPEGTYFLRDILIADAPTELADGDWSQIFDALELPIADRSNSPRKATRILRILGGIIRRHGTDDQIPRTNEIPLCDWPRVYEVPKSDPYVFEAQTGGVNTWRITIPETLETIVRCNDGLDPFVGKRIPPAKEGATVDESENEIEDASE